MSNKEIEYNTVTEVAGPLIIIKGIKDVSYNEVVRIKTSSGENLITKLLPHFLICFFIVKN